MNPPRASQPTARFGSFEVDFRAGELRKHGLRVRLQVQPFQILAMLLERPGEIVTREELRHALWPSDTFVDFDHGLNNAINRLREVLGDSAESPRYVETLPRRGYRFIASVEQAAPMPAPATPGSPVETVAGAVPRHTVKSWIVAAAMLGVAVALLLGLRAAVWHQRAKATASAPRIQSLAVLPLENLSGDPSQEYFVDGMTEELITNLAKIGGLRVISRTSAMHYKGTRKTLPEIAGELNVDAVVEGGVLRSGDRVRITAQLIRTASDQHLWAEEFERDLRDVLALQSDVARAIATQIRVTLTHQMRVASARSIDPEAYEYYLRGRYNFWERWSKGGYDNAIRYFEMAIKKDPNYAPPYAGLAFCYALGFFQDQELPPREAWSKAAAAARKAVELDDQLAEAHIAMADVRFRFDWNWAEAEREYKRGLELSPNAALSHWGYSIFLGIMGRLDKAMTEARRAQELDPLSPGVSNSLSIIYNWSRRWDDAIAQSRRTLQLDPNFIPAHDALAQSYEEKAMYAQAVSEELKVHALQGHSPEQIEGLRKAFAASGIRGFWENSLEWQKQHQVGNFIFMARMCMRLGRTDEAFYWLEKAYQARVPTVPNINIATWLDPVRSDPRYADLMRRIGLPP